MLVNVTYRTGRTSYRDIINIHFMEPLAKVNELIEEEGYTKFNEMK